MEFVQIAMRVEQTKGSELRMFESGNVLMSAHCVIFSLKHRLKSALVEHRSVALEEFARQMIHVEEMHAGEVDKMPRRPGEVTTAADRKPGQP